MYQIFYYYKKKKNKTVEMCIGKHYIQQETKSAENDRGSACGGEEITLAMPEEKLDCIPTTQGHRIQRHNLGWTEGVWETQPHT
jgi:hypothetical protein